MKGDNGEEYSQAESYFIGIRVKSNEKRQRIQIDLNSAIRDYFKYFLAQVQETSFYQDVKDKNIDMNFQYLKRDQLPTEIKEEYLKKTDKLLGKRRQSEDRAERD